MAKDFLRTISSEHPNFMSHFDIITTACDFAVHAHRGQKRKYSGEPYLIHPLSVALLCAKNFNDIDLLIAAILHDCVEDNTHIEAKEIYEKFWKNIGFIVDSVTDTTNFFAYNEKVIFNDKIEKILYGGMYDIRCILLKLYDREHNINTLSGLEPHKQIRMSFETQAIYEPLKKLFGGYQDTPLTIEACETILHHYLHANHITTPTWLKEALLNQAFFSFDNDTFNIVYKNTNRIFRQIDDKKVFEKLVESKNFDEKIEVISIQQNGQGKFLAIFKYKRGNIFEDLDSKFKIHTNFS